MSRKRNGRRSALSPAQQMIYDSARDFEASGLTPYQWMESRLGTDPMSLEIKASSDALIDRMIAAGELPADVRGEPQR